MPQPDPFNRIELLKQVHFDPSIDTCHDTEVTEESLRAAMEHASRGESAAPSTAGNGFDELLRSNQLDHLESRFEWPAEFQEDDEALTLPVRLGDFCQVTPIRRGRHAYLCLAFDEKLGRDVALKIPRADSNGKPFDLRHEIDALRRHDDERIVRLIQVVSSPAGEVPVIEFVDGWSLRDLLNASPLSVSEVAALGYEIGRGLETLSRGHTVHRDIKPDNLMLARRGVLKIVDLGTALATQTVPSDVDSQPRFVCGTPGYMAPEQEEDSNRVDFTADHYAFGVTLCELFTGDRPAHRAEDGEPLTDQQWDDSIRAALPKSLPADLREVVLKLTCRYRKQRQSSLSHALPVLKKHAGDIELVDLANRFEALSGNGGIRERETQSTNRPHSTRKWIFLGGVVALLIAMGLLNFAKTGSMSAPSALEAISGVWVSDSITLQSELIPRQLEIGIHEQRFLLFDRGRIVFVGSFRCRDYDQRDGVETLTLDIKPKATTSQERFLGLLKLQNGVLMGTFKRSRETSANQNPKDKPADSLEIICATHYSWPLSQKNVRNIMGPDDQPETIESVEKRAKHIEWVKDDFQKAGNLRNRYSELGILPPAPFDAVQR